VSWPNAATDAIRLAVASNNIILFMDFLRTFGLYHMLTI